MRAWPVVASGAIALTIAAASPVVAQTVSLDVEIAAARLGVTLPDSVLRQDSVRRPLDELHREKCDQAAIKNLGEALEKAGYRREAAVTQTSFSKSCGGDAPSLRRAVNILLGLKDHAAAIDVASALIKLEPYGDNGYYLRALGYDRSGEHKKAIDDYLTAIELFGDKERISSVGYLSMARSYEKLGQYCDALTPIESWIALNPARNETSQTRMILAEFSAKGKCAAPPQTGDVVVPITRAGQTVTLSASINGVAGRFILDTGATFVSLRRSYADRAKVMIDEASSVRMHTANGVTDAKRGQARTIALGKIAASDVAIVVQNDDRATYGENIDGLLGMSFLARYDVAIDARQVRIKPRSRR